MVKILIDHGADVNLPTSGDEPQSSYLWLAVMEQSVDTVRLLLEAGARVNDTYVETGTALQAAARRNNEELVEILLAAGADLDCLGLGNNEFQSKCREAAREHNYEFFTTPLQHAAANNNTEMVQILLDAGAGVNAFPAGYYVRWISQIIEGADPKEIYEYYRSDDEKDQENDIYDAHESVDIFYDWTGEMMTPLHSAVANNNIILTRLLINLGAHVNAIGSRGTPLQIASANPEGLKTARLLLRKGADVNSLALMPRSRTAIQAAAGSAAEDVVECLLKAGADVNAPPNAFGGRTAAQAAAESGSLRIIKLLVDAGADVNSSAASRSGRTCLQAAASEGHCDVVQYLLQLGVDVDDPASVPFGRTSLNAAIICGHDSIAKKLIDVGANIDMAADVLRGGTPLQLAMEHSRYELVHLLLDRGANPKTTNRSSPPLKVAISQGQTELVRRLIGLGADVNRCTQEHCSRTLLEISLQSGDVSISRMLIDAGADINGANGTQALLQAVRGNSMEIVQLLLSSGINPNPSTDIQHTSPLSQALTRWSINEAMVYMLLDHGAEVNADHGRPLQLAAAHGEVDMVKLLLRFGADVNAPALGTRRTALQGAAGTKNLDLVTILLDAGADINAPPCREWGATALQAAVSNARLDMVQLLLSHGADVNGPPSRSHGATALQRAAIDGHLRMVSMLLRNGADVNAAGAAVGGRTALEAAAEHGRLDIIYLLLRNDEEEETIGERCKRAAELAFMNDNHIIARVLREWNDAKPAARKES